MRVPRSPIPGTYVRPCLPYLFASFHLPRGQERRLVDAGYTFCHASSSGLLLCIFSPRCLVAPKRVVRILTQHPLLLLVLKLFELVWSTVSCLPFYFYYMKRYPPETKAVHTTSHYYFKSATGSSIKHAPRTAPGSRTLCFTKLKPCLLIEVSIPVSILGKRDNERPRKGKLSVKNTPTGYSTGHPHEYARRDANTPTLITNHGTDYSLSKLKHVE